MGNTDSIAAIATATGEAGVGIVRISGDCACAIGSTIVGSLPPPRQMALRWFHTADGSRIDRGLVVQFSGPYSYTGEDMIELQAHGGPVVLQLVLEAALAAGARMAQPGEFTQRAFLNGKLDLTQAEAIADLIGSRTEQAARAATRSLSGEFAAAVGQLQQSLTHLRMHVEAAIDFPEEEIDFLDAPALSAEIDQVTAAFEHLQQRVQTGRRLQDGMDVALVGAPNVGKSSLMNEFAGEDAAIVTDIAGTTRDLVRTQINIGGAPVQLIDTAGLHDSDDVVEREGMRRTRRAIDESDVVLAVVAANDPALTDTIRQLVDLCPVDVPLFLVINKCDLVRPAEMDVPARVHVVHVVSAFDGEGIDALRRDLGELALGGGNAEGSLSARVRQVRLLEQAKSHFDVGVQQLRSQRAGELLAEELSQAQRCLGQITGEFTADDLLGTIFGEFCIGK
ncbi:MAG: tRNA uridine-5-carboxymethylaminomethyl(34) synthesis GTPase MnmE [Pseudomonadota bacterium]